MGIILKSKWLFLIVFLGALLRFTASNQLPPSLNWDEISHGYDAYSILKTGRDQWGELLPIANFRAYGDYPLPLNLYLTIPFEMFFGVNQTAIRLPHAMLGTLTIVSVYFLCFGITKNKKISLLASLLVAIDPWFLFPSRAVFQSNLSVFFLISAFAIFFNREKNRWFLPLSALFFGLTLFSYHSTRILTPLLVIGLVFFYRKEFLDLLKKRSISTLVTVFFTLLFFIPLPFILLNPQARARSGVVFIVDQAGINKINDLRNSSNMPLKNLIYNKVTYFGVSFVKNYVNYFSPSFLFLNGGTQYQFSVPHQGLLYLVALPFLYLGFLILIYKSFKDRNWRYVLFWLILSPIPAAITQDQSAVIRATTMLPIPEILIALGFFFVLRRINNLNVRQILFYGYIVALLLSLENYMNVYAKSYRTNYSWAWQYGYQQAIDYVRENAQSYDQIITTKAYGEPHEYFLFFLKYDPAKYKSDPNLIRFYQSNWYWVDHFDKFWFVNDWQVTQLSNKNEFITESKHIINCNNQKCLLVTTPNNYPVGWKKVNEVNFLDGKTAFEMWSNVK